MVLCLFVQDEAQLSHVMSSLSDGRELDAELFQRLIVTTRSVAVARPANLVKFAEKATTAVQTEPRESLRVMVVTIGNAVTQVNEVFKIF